MQLKPFPLFSGLMRAVFIGALSTIVLAANAPNAQTLGVSQWAYADGIMGETAVLKHRLVASQTSAHAGDEMALVWEFEMQPEWHIYWQNAGDSGLPPQLTLLPNPTAKQGEVLPLTYPAPQLIELPPITNYGYKGKVALGSRFMLPASGSPLSFKAEFLYCKDVCLPGSATLTLPLGIGPRQPNALYAEPAQPPAWNGGTIEALTNGTAVQLTLPFAAEGVRFIPNADGLIDDAAPQIAKGNTLRITLDTTVQPKPEVLEGLLVRGTEAWAVKLPLAVGTLASATPPVSFWVALTGAFLAGLILNLMPCVLPVLSLKVLSLMKHHTPKSRRAHALAYTAGVVASFWAFAALIAALKASGATLGWGFHLQQPLVVGGLTLLMVGLALNFWGVFSVGEGLTRLGAKPRKPGTEPLSTSAATGLLAVVVATPCTVPFMGAALGYALTQSVWASFAIFTAMGVGMALPFLLLAFTNKAAAWLPKPGAWMATFKHALGWPMLLTALWLAYVFASLTAEFAGQVALFALLLGATLLAFALWLYGQNPNRLRAALVVGAVLSSFVMLSPLTRPSPAQAVWAEWSVAAVEAARAEGRPVFVDFTADWCLTCKVTEATVLNTSAVQALFAENNVALFKADWTARDDAITAELAKHGRQGVPLYLLYLPNQPEPQILPQLLSLGVLRGALEIK